MGVTAGHVVVGLGGIETGPDDRFEGVDARGRGVGELRADVGTSRGERLERGERVADHRVEIERTSRLIQGPEGFRTVGVELKERVELGLGKVRGWDLGVVERAEQRQRVQPCRFEPRAQGGRVAVGRWC